jgi:hypothetical protein
MENLRAALNGRGEEQAPYCRKLDKVVVLVGETTWSPGRSVRRPRLSAAVST